MKIGIDLGGSHIGMGVVNEKGEIVDKFEKRITKTEREDINKSLKDYVVEYIIQGLEIFIKKYYIDFVGISVPGTVMNNVIVKAVNLGIENFDIVDVLKQGLINSNIEEGFKQRLINSENNKNSNDYFCIKLKNDAKCAAIAENEYGCLKKYDRSIFLTLGTGIGGATIINNKLLDTGEYPGCEFGHMVIEKNGYQCKCGKKGCWEKYASMKSLKNFLRTELGLSDLTRGEDLIEIIRNNSPESENFEKIEGVVSEFINNLSIGIANLVNIFEPKAVGIGGSFVFFKDVLLDRLNKKLHENGVLFNARSDLKIEVAVLGNDAGIIGATSTM